MRVVDPYKIRLVTTGTTIEDKEIVVPIGNAFDGIGQNQQVEDYVEKLADDSVNPIVDYEKMRYTPYSGTSATSGVTETMGYDFYFYGQADETIGKDMQSFYLNGTTLTPLIVNDMWTPTWQSNSSVVSSVFVLPTLYAMVNVIFNCNIEYDGAFGHTVSTMNGVLTITDPSIAPVIRLSYIDNGQTFYLDESVALSVTKVDLSDAVSSGSFTNYKWNRECQIKATFNIPSLDINTLITLESKKEKVTVNPLGAGYLTKLDKVTTSIINGSTLSVIYKQKSSVGYGTSYSINKIPSLYVTNSFKGYTTSYFRLDYFDSVIEEAQNLLFTDVLTVSEGVNPSDAIFETKLNKQNYFLYWLKDDPIIEEQGYRDVYMTARFFNASTGLIQQFFHLSDEWSQPLLSSYLPNVDQYQTLMKYTKIRLFKNYRYIICKRTLTLPSSTLSGTTVGGFDITDSDTIGVNKISLNQIRLK